MNIPCWSGEKFWDDFEQFTTPTPRVHHGQRTGWDYKGTGDCLALSWHLDKVVFEIVTFLSANMYDCQTRLGWKQLLLELAAADRSSEALMDSVMNVSSRTATSSLSVHETEPIDALPPDTSVPVYVPSGDSDMAEMQSGVRPEPTIFPKRQQRPPLVLQQFTNRSPWADEEDSENEEAETAPHAIN
eukprot:16447752-Heterocapsa_arctica.AAC.1